MKYIPSSQAVIVKNIDYSKQILLTSADFHDDGHGLQTVVIPPQTKQRNHLHHIQTEVFFILEGTCSIFINDEEYLANPGDAFICEPNDRHYLWNRSDLPFKLVVFKINKKEGDEDTTWLE